MGQSFIIKRTLICHISFIIIIILFIVKLISITSWITQQDNPSLKPCLPTTGLFRYCFTITKLMTNHFSIFDTFFSYYNNYFLTNHHHPFLACIFAPWPIFCALGFLMDSECLLLATSCIFYIIEQLYQWR